MMQQSYKIRSTRLLVAEYETEIDMKFITGEDLELCTVTNQRNKPEKLNLMKRYKKHFTKFVLGEIFDELEVEGFYEKDLQKCKLTELSLKTRSLISIPARCIKRSFC